ncbi:hypothetical protein AB0F72_37750 [Actinoplanes sp. NPDC023936]|uniref:hypothetical protein n=1 Tax=Actinoplanes sp. NPDC023936 TaxID=3154910 RepID=UPI0033DE8F43
MGDRGGGADTTLAPVDQTSVEINGIQYGGGAAVLARELDQPPAGTLIPWRGWLQGISAVLALGTLLVVIAGPAPVRGTRWYWFWLTLVTSYGLGMLLWLFRDRPWVSVTEEPGDRDRGLIGLGAALLANIAIAIVLFGVGRLLGT